MKKNVSELTGPALDWAVAQCEDVSWWQFQSCQQFEEHAYQYSSNWLAGGPIIEREGITVDCVRCDRHIDSWAAALPTPRKLACVEGVSTPLVAAMRCYCCAKLGDEVEIPEELL